MLASSEKATPIAATSQNTSLSRVAARNGADSYIRRNNAPIAHTGTGFAVSSSQQQAIADWLQKNANATDGFAGISYNEAGGERVATALNGFSSLGALTTPRKAFSDCARIATVARERQRRKSSRRGKPSPRQ